MTPESDLIRARAALVEAELTELPADRFLIAYQAAGQVAAVALTLRVPTGPRAAGIRAGRCNGWELLARVAPELGEWAGYFLALHGKVEVVRAGSVRLVTARDADDLVRDGYAFCEVVSRRLAIARRAQGRRTARESVAAEKAG